MLFLRYLLRQIRGPIVLLWDGGSIHTGQELDELMATLERLMGITGCVTLAWRFAGGYACQDAYVTSAIAARAATVDSC